MKSPAFLLLLLHLFTTLSLNPSTTSSSAFSLTSRRFGDYLIRSLNLEPHVSDVVPPFPDFDSPLPRLVEKKLNLHILGDSGSNASLEDLGHHAGYYRLQHTHASRLFYFFFESRGGSDDPVVLWLTGGPGCSSELALFYENGPFIITDNLTLTWNNYGWDKVSNLIYVDQPTGTGFSYSTDIRDIRFDEKGISNDMYDFLQAFFEEHPEYLKNDFYISGESYAGHYIPAIAERVHRGNKDENVLLINLKGFAIGNGLTNPAIQYAAYPDYALEMGLIKQTQYKIISKFIPACEWGIKRCGGPVSCIASFFVCNAIFTSILGFAGNINYYDIRKECKGSLCYDFSRMDKFLNKKAVREALGVGNKKFVSCSPVVYEAMITDWMKNLEVGIPSLLEDGIKGLIYAGEYDLICNWLVGIPSLLEDGIKGLIYTGEYDLICNWLGNFRWVNSMEWSGQKMFVEALDKPFLVDNKEMGLLKSFGPLSFLKVYNAGHMVPMDQPKAALEMLKWWIGESTEAEYSHRATDM